MKKILIVVLALLVIFSFAACGGDSGGGGGTVKNEKRIMYEIYNESGGPLVYEGSFFADNWDGIDALNAADFIVGTGRLGAVNEDWENIASYGWPINKTSENTYEMTLYFVAGPVPAEEEYLYLDPAMSVFYPDAIGKIYSVDIKGKFNELAVVKFDGSSFTQVQ